MVSQFTIIYMHSVFAMIGIKAVTHCMHIVLMIMYHIGNTTCSQ